MWAFKLCFHIHGVGVQRYLLISNRYKKLYEGYPDNEGPYKFSLDCSSFSLSFFVTDFEDYRIFSKFF